MPRRVPASTREDSLRRLRARFLAGTAATVLLWAAPARADSFPLQYAVDSDSSLRLLVYVGIGDGAPKPYLFDTGSSSFNFAYDPSWVPPATSTLVGSIPYLYGDGTYGFLLNQVTYPSLTFYTPAGAPVQTLTAPGAGFQVAQGTYIVTTGGTGPVLYTNADNVPYSESLAWAQALAAGQAPMAGTFYGVFGAGAFVSHQGGATLGGVLGQATTSGYVVAANGPAGLPCSPCVTLGLTPELRAQFTTLVPWSESGSNFPVSGANGGTEFNLVFTYALSAPGLATVTWASPTLLDTGTELIEISTSADIASYVTPSTGAVIAGSTLTVAAAVPGAAATAIVSAPDAPLPTDLIQTIGNGVGILGIAFFTQNSVLFDLENMVIGYTSSFVTDMPMTTPVTIGPEIGPIGLAGVVSGSGGLGVAAGGVLTLSAANTYTGGTGVAAGGWLALAGPGSIAASAGLQLDGTLDISRTASGAAVAMLSGNGVVDLGAQTLTITAGTGLFSGSLRDGGIGGGTGGGLIIAGGIQQLSGTSTYTGGTAIAAGAGLVLSGALQGLVVNNGSLDNSGAIDGPVLNAGLFVNNGRVTGSVLDTGLLTGTGYIGGALVVNGRVAPGNSIGAMAVNGNVAFQPGSAFIAELGASGTSDLLAVDGSVSVEGGTLALVPGTGFSPTLGARYVVLTAAGGIAGSFALDPTYFGTAGSVLPFLAPDVVSDGTAMGLTLVRSLVPFTALARTPNEIGAATGAAGLGDRTLLNRALVGVTRDQAPAAFDALSGEVYPSALSVLQSESLILRRAVLDRAAAPLRDPKPGAFAGVSPPGVPGDPDAFWAQGFGAWSRIDGNGNAATVSGDTGGVLVGYDRGFTLGEGDVRAGFAAGYSAGSYQVDARSSGFSTDTAHVALYGGAAVGALGVRLGGAYSWTDLAASRTVAFPGFADAVTADTSARTAQVFGEIGYAFALAGQAVPGQRPAASGTAGLEVEPFVGLAYVDVAMDGFTETGGVAALTGRGSQAGVTYSTLGARLSAPLAFGVAAARFRGTLAWQHAFGDTAPETLIAFGAAATLPFAISGVPVAADSALVEAGLDIAFTPAATLSVFYAGQLAQAETSNLVKGTFSLRF
ncbi:autotransporter domain-containing protein [Aquabacter spiritensis]|uniref:autotransporter family protein n=1 Tax=Aquabacter spiritensis TaxID=933073 RepID=UPI0010461749|nr:autotransporter domain-containing protein [Aquabacter spiritensis]